MKNQISVGDQRISDADRTISVGDWVIGDADLVLKLYYSYFYIETKGTFHPLKRIIILYPKGFKNQVVARVARRCKALATELPVIISRLEACCKSGKGFGNRLIQTLFKSEKSEFVTYSYPYCTIFRFRRILKSSIKYKTVINGAVNSIIQIRDDIS